MSLSFFCFRLSYEHFKVLDIASLDNWKDMEFHLEVNYEKKDFLQEKSAHDRDSLMIPALGY